MFTAIIPILCNINPCMLFLLSIEKKKNWEAHISLPFLNDLQFLHLSKSCFDQCVRVYGIFLHSKVTAYNTGDLSLLYCISLAKPM